MLTLGLIIEVSMLYVSFVDFILSIFEHGVSSFKWSLALAYKTVIKKFLLPTSIYTDG